MLESYRSKFPLENVAVAFFCLALIGIVLAVTMQRIRFERNETIAAVVKQNSNLAIAFEEHTVRTLKGIDQALQLIKHRYEQEGLKLILHKLVEDGEIDPSSQSMQQTASTSGFICRETAASCSLASRWWVASPANGRSR